MKVVVDREKFVEAFGIALGFAPSRSPKEVLMNVRMRAMEGGCFLVATDIDSGIHLGIDPAYTEVLSPGDVLLSRDKGGAIFREIGGEKITIETSDAGVTIKSDNGRFVLPTQNPDEFPMPKAWSGDPSITVSTQLFRELISRTAFCCDVASTRYALGGVRLEVDGQEVLAVGTDGRRLGLQRGKGSQKGNERFDCIVPQKQSLLMSRVASGDSVDLSIGTNEILMRDARSTVYSRLVEGRFPNWRQVIPNQPNPKVAKVVNGPFASACRQAAIVSGEESRGVTFGFADGSVNMSSETADVGRSNINVPVEWSADGPLSVTVDHRFVSDFLRVLPLDAKVSLSMESDSSPILCTTEDGYQYVIMPMAK